MEMCMLNSESRRTEFALTLVSKQIKSEFIILVVARWVAGSTRRLCTRVPESAKFLYVARQGPEKSHKGFGWSGSGQNWYMPNIVIFLTHAKPEVYVARHNVLGTNRMKKTLLKKKFWHSWRVEIMIDTWFKTYCVPHGSTLCGHGSLLTGLSRVLNNDWMAVRCCLDNIPRFGWVASPVRPQASSSGCL